MHELVKRTTVLSALAGFIGGGLAHWLLLSPAPAYGQLLIPPPSRPSQRQAATEVDAQHFVLVDSAGKIQAEIRLVNDQPQIILYKRDGRIGWKATPQSGSPNPELVHQ